jgi:hypothetical protein
MCRCFKDRAKIKTGMKLIMKRKLDFVLRVIFLMILMLSNVHSSSAGRKQNKNVLAPTPPMGWNSWDCYGTTVTEAEVKANADYMAKHLRKYGWQYIVVDIQWSDPNAKAHGYIKDTHLAMDEYGRLIPAENRFPSSTHGKGFKPLADYIHKLGLKFGIHIMRGIPKRAVGQNLPIYNSKFTARDAADTNSVCPWNTDMYGVKIGSEAGQAYYNSILQLYAKWGVDYIKADDMTAFSGKPADKNRLNDITALSKAIKNSQRKIVLSLSPGPASIDQAEFLEQHAQLWRISDDFWDKWSDIKQQFGFMRNWLKHIGPTTWPDADMLPLGKIGLRAERGDARSTNFTKNEQYTLMTLWSMFRSPLMFGGNLPDNDEFTLSLITNEEVLAVNQKSEKNRELYSDDNKVIWTANVPGTNEQYIAIFNISDNVLKNAKIEWKELAQGYTKYSVRNLWEKKNLGEFENEFTVDLEPHSCVLIKIKPIK